MKLSRRLPLCNIWIPLLLLALLPAAWWWPLLAGWLPDFMDTVTYLYPMRIAIARQLGDGTLPLWMPNLFSGVPLAANPQLATWYPPQALFYVAPTPLLYGFLLVFHYVWAGWGMFFLGRSLTRNSIAALFSAISFQFSAMMISRIALAPHVYSAAWLPWIFLAATRLLAAPGPRGAALLALPMAMQFLAGSPQFSYYTVLALGLLMIVRWRRAARAWRWIGAAGVTAFLLTGIQLLPTLDFLSLSGRGAIPLPRLQEQALNDGYVWRSVTGVTGNPIEDTDSVNAVGPGALLLALAALVSRRYRRRALPFVVIAAVSWVLSLGTAAPWLHGILPGYDRFHAPRRALMLWSFAMPVAAALGAAWLLQRARPRWLGPTVLIAALSGTVWMLPRLERVFADPGRFDGNPKTLQTIGTDRFLVIDPTFNYAYDSRGPDYGVSMMTNLAALHDTMDVQGYDPLVPARYAAARDLACATSGVFYPSHGAYFTDPAHPLLRMLNVQYLLGRIEYFDPGRVLPGRQVDTAAVAGMVDLVTSDSRWPLYRFRQPRPFAWPVENAFPAATSTEALAAAATADPSRYAFIEQPFATPANLSTAPLSARYATGREIRVELKHPAPSPVLAAVSVAYAPGWYASAGDGTILDLLPVNGLIMGVVIPPGHTTAVLRYQPASFLRGSLFTLAGCLVTVVLLVARKRPVRAA